MTVIKPYRKKDYINIYLENLNPEQKAEDEFFKSSDSEGVSAELYKSLMLKNTGFGNVVCRKKTTWISNTALWQKQ